MKRYLVKSAVQLIVMAVLSFLILRFQFCPIFIFGPDEGGIVLNFILTNILAYITGIILVEILIFRKLPRLLAIFTIPISGFLGSVLGSLVGSFFDFAIGSSTGKYNTNLDGWGLLIGSVICIVLFYNYLNDKRINKSRSVTLFL